MDLNLALSNAQASVFSSELYLFISSIEQRDGPYDASVSVTIIPGGDHTQYIVRFERSDDAQTFSERVRPLLLGQVASKPARSWLNGQTRGEEPDVKIVS